MSDEEIKEISEYLTAEEALELLTIKIPKHKWEVRQQEGGMYDFVCKCGAYIPAICISKDFVPNIEKTIIRIFSIPESCEAKNMKEALE